MMESRSQRGVSPPIEGVAFAANISMIAQLKGNLVSHPSFCSRWFRVMSVFIVSSKIIYTKIDNKNTWEESESTKL